MYNITFITKDLVIKVILCRAVTQQVHIKVQQTLILSEVIMEIHDNVKMFSCVLFTECQ